MAEGEELGPAKADRTRGIAHAIAMLALLGVAIALHGMPFPASNEGLYLLVPYHQWNPGSFVGDWTLGAPWYSYGVFNGVIGPLTIVFPLPAIAWTGRLLCWMATFWALIRLGQRFGLPLWMTTGSIAMWLIQGQALVGGEWAVGGFEAKSVAYPFLLFAIVGFASGRGLLPAACLGIAFSFHMQATVFAGAAVGLCLLFSGATWSHLLKVGGVLLLFSLPGVVAAIQVMASGGGPTPTELGTFVLDSAPHHLDPFTWPMREILFQYLLFFFSAFHALRAPAHRVLRFSAGIQAFTCFFFSAALLLRGAGFEWTLAFGLLRPFPILATLLFFFHLSHFYHYAGASARRPALAAFALVALLGLHNPIGASLDRIQITQRFWQRASDPMADCFRWVAGNTPAESVGLLPPWRTDGWYLSQRPQVVTRYPVMTGFSEWRERLESIVGDSWIDREQVNWGKGMNQSYTSLSEARVRELATRFGVGFIVTRASYSLPRLFEAKDVRVYDLASTTTNTSERPLLRPASGASPP